MGLETCENECAVIEERCVDDCNNVMSQHNCKELEHCTWLFSRHTGDDGRCIWRKEKNYSCSDIKRYNECYDGGNIDILYNKCEFYKDECKNRCEIYLDMESCVKDGNDNCIWLNNETTKDTEEKCILKVC
jgi:hypothetical protein